MSAFTNKILPLLFIVLLNVLLPACVNSEEIESISQTELLTKIQTKQPPLILDVRSKHEYDSGHIPGAINISFERLDDRIDRIDRHKNSTVVVYCERGFRARVAETTLNQAGFTSILHLEGDMSQWRTNSLPIEESS